MEVLLRIEYVIHFFRWYHHGQNCYKENSLQRKCFGAINFVIITKESLYKANSLAWSLVKKMVPRNCFVIISARMVFRKSFLVRLKWRSFKGIPSHSSHCSGSVFPRYFGGSPIRAPLRLLVCVPGRGRFRAEKTAENRPLRAQR